MGARGGGEFVSRKILFVVFHPTKNKQNMKYESAENFILVFARATGKVF